jgi:hypothetical protein
LFSSPLCITAWVPTLPWWTPHSTNEVWATQSSSFSQPVPNYGHHQGPH